MVACKLVIIPQVICMETWFLGNGKIYSRVPPSAECAAYANHYDVANSDPELMGKSAAFNGTNADFHYEYLKTMLRAKIFVIANLIHNRYMRHTILMS